MTHAELSEYEALTFEIDGSLRVIVVPHVDLSVWQRFIDHGCAHYPIRVSSADRPAILPPASKLFSIGPEDPTWALSIDLGGPFANCFFTDENSLIADLDPLEIQTRTAVDRVFAFLADVARVAGASAFLGGEGLQYDLNESPDASRVRRGSYYEYSLEHGLRALRSRS